MESFVDMLIKDIKSNDIVAGLVYVQSKHSDLMKYNDHSWKHLDIVCQNSLKIYELLNSKGIEGDLKRLGFDDREIKSVLVLSSYLHDVGMGIDRKHHHIFSAVLSFDVSLQILSKYFDRKKAVVMSVEISHIVQNHRSEGAPLLLEGEIVRVADALDMEKGRAAREGDVDDIHRISALSIDRVFINKGDGKPVKVDVWMKDMGGMFHVSYFLKKKIGKKIKRYLDVYVHSKGEIFKVV